MVDIAKRLLRGQSVGAVAQDVGLSEHRVRKMAARALRAAGRLELHEMGKIPDPLVGKDFEGR